MYDLSPNFQFNIFVENIVIGENELENDNNDMKNEMYVGLEQVFCILIWVNTKFKSLKSLNQ